MTSFDRDRAYARAVDFMRAVEERSYTRTEKWTLGTAFFHDSYPVKWVLNFMRLEHDDPAVSAEDVADEADRIMGGAGLGHRMLHVYDLEAAERLRPGLEALGWRDERLLLMGLATVPPVFHAEGVEVREISQEEMHEVARHLATQHYPQEAENAEQLASSREVTVKAANVTSVGGLIHGQIVGSCDLYDGGDIGQVEEVDTLEGFRKRGVAKAVVTTAIAISQQRGHDLTFLIADDKDWPKNFYARLGFVAVGYVYEFRRTEQGH